MKGLPQSHYFYLKGKMPLIRAVALAFIKMPDELTGYQLYRATMMYYFHPGVYIDTVLQRMRELKASSKIDHICIDFIESHYKKKPCTGQ